MIKALVEVVNEVGERGAHAGQGVGESVALYELWQRRL
jgi:hypothetical protein